MIHRVLADVVLLLHVAFVGFVVIGLALIVLGAFRGWRWIRSPAFRYAHLMAIAYVVAQEWIGVTCPLTTLEMALRARAGEASYAGSFVVHWLGALLYYQAPPLAFALGYTGFGLLVLVSWFTVRPRTFQRA